MLCQCRYSIPVVTIAGRVTCLACSQPRRPKPTPCEDRAKYGPMTQYISPELYGIYGKLAKNNCQLEFVSILCNARRLWNDMIVSSAMIRLLAEQNGMDRNLWEQFTLTVPELGWVEIAGPTSGAYGYMSYTHVSTDYFEGARFACVWRNEQRCQGRFTRFPNVNPAGKLVMLGTNTITFTTDSAVWTPGVTPGTSLVETGDLEFATALVNTMPRDYVAMRSWISDKPTGYGFNDPSTGWLKFENGTCWTALFQDGHRELLVARQMGYQLPYGVQGRYLARRLQCSGLKLVRKSDGVYHAYTFHQGGWLGHIGYSSEPIPEGCHVIATFDVVPYNEYSPHPLYKLPGKVWFGGQAPSAPLEPLQERDRHMPGFCWALLFNNRTWQEEVRMAVGAGIQQNDGVPGPYLMHRLAAHGLGLRECDYGKFFIFEDPPSGVKHIALTPFGQSGVYLGRYNVVPGPSQVYITGLVGKRKGRRRSRASSSSESESDSEQPKPKITFGAPAEEATEVVVVSGAAPGESQPATVDASTADEKSVVVNNGDCNSDAWPIKPLPLPTPSRFSALATLKVGTNTPVSVIPKGTYTLLPPVPSDGSCGYHIIQQIISHMLGREAVYVRFQRDSSQWMDNFNLFKIIQAIRLPVGFNNCPHMRYVIRLTDQHWEVYHNPSVKEAYSTGCASGYCLEVKCPINAIENSNWLDISGLYAEHPNFDSPDEFGTVVQSLAAHFIDQGDEKIPKIRAKTLLNIMKRGRQPKGEENQPLLPPPAEDEKPKPTPRQRAVVSDNSTLSSQSADATIKSESPAVTSGEGVKTVLDSLLQSAPQKGKLTSLKEDIQKGLTSLGDQVSRFQPHLLAFLCSPSSRVSLPVLVFSHFLLLLACFFALAPSIWAVPITAGAWVLAGRHRSVRAITALVLCFLCFTTVFPEAESVCESDGPDCRDRLTSLANRFRGSVIRYIGAGPGTCVLLFARSLYYFESAASLLYFLLFVLDLALLCCILSYNRICLQCYGCCIRKAPEEIVLKTIPLSRISRSTLLDICDNFSRPPVDVILQATGWRGCYTGCFNPVVDSASPIPVSRVDPKKITSNTICTLPVCPAEAVKAIHVLHNRGQLAFDRTAKVEKVETLPCKNPFFPYDVMSRKIVAVDSATFELFTQLGLDTSMLVLGQGDFFEAMGVTRPTKLAAAALRVRGGKLCQTAFVTAWIIFFVTLGYWLQLATPCGYGTSDPFCKSAYGYLVSYTQGVCYDGYCASSLGYSRQTLFIPPIPGTFTIAVIICAIVAVNLLSKMPLDYFLSAVFLLLPTGTYYTLCRIAIFILGMNHVSCFTVASWLAIGLILDINAFFVCIAVVVLGWIVSNTGCCGLVTPYDIHRVIRTSRDAVNVYNAPAGTYLHAVKMAALTNSNKFFIASNAGYVLEGALRSKGRTDNAVGVFGTSVGSGGLFNRNGKTIVVTASHVIGDRNEGYVDLAGIRTRVQFVKKGDFAEGEIDVPGTYPDFKPVTNYVGRAYWLCQNGVEAGFIAPTGCVVFTGPGDSGSPIITPDGSFIGVHTGSDAKGCGAFTTMSGETIHGVVPLSVIAPHYDGVSTTVKHLPKNVVADVTTVPHSLANILEKSINLEGSLGTIQLLVVAIVLWRACTTPAAVPFVVLFFVLNELLPKSLFRGCYNFVLFALAVCTNLSPKILLIRLLTAALNRNIWSLVLHIGFAAIALINDTLILGNYQLAIQKCSFYVTGVNHETHISLAIGAILVISSIILEIFGHPQLGNLLSGAGYFDATFFMRYVNEGIRTGVSTGIGKEGLTAALATTLTEEELGFLTAIMPIKAFTSSMNLQNALKDYAISQKAKNLQNALRSVHALASGQQALAKLSDFITNTKQTASVGEMVVHLGNPSGPVFQTFVGDKEFVAEPIVTQIVAGTSCTLARLVAVAEGGLITDGKYLKHNGKVLADHPGFVVENDARGARETRDRDQRLAESKHVDTVVVRGVKYDKMWDTVTGDTYYVLHESAPRATITPEALADAQQEIVHAAQVLNQSVDVSDVEKKKLLTIISKLQKLTTTQALNC
uniref:Polyprotein n=1 Tax=Kibale red colobus virus 2 TaxID=1936072 RepID=X2D5G8_9NIDO|nr:polyprotein [Kibale red colobus virus 2]